MSTSPSETLAARSRFITEAPLAVVLRRLVLPASVWYLLNYSFFMADSYFVGRLGTDKLAVMGLVTAVLMLTLTLAQGLGAALSALASFMLGAGQQAGAARLVFHTLLLGVVVALALLVLGTPSTHALFTALGATDAMQVDADAYMEIWYLGFVFAISGVIGQSAMRATGDVVTPALILLSTGLLNVVLDPILIFGLGPLPALGMRGAAIAGVLARAIGAVITFWLVARRDRLLSVRELAGLGRSWAQLGKIALPVALQMMSFGLVAAFTLRIAGSLGASAVAALGVGSRIEAVVAALTFGLPIILPMFIGQNVGAGKTARAGQGILLGARQVAVVQLGIALVLALLAPWLGRPFSADEEVRSALEVFAWYTPFSYAGYALTGAAAGVFITLGRMGSYLAIAALPTIPSLALAWLGARSFGFPGLLCALSFVRIATGVIAWLWLTSLLRSLGYLEHKPESEPMLTPAIDALQGEKS